jgi:2-desacetyl-2-hydroxyethyl bacteriochlorophyllide A dehydrogenase
MKALVCITPYKFDYAVIETPIFIEGRTLLKIKRIGICGTDLHAFEGVQPFFSYPRILGHELAAQIVETKAHGFKNGQSVTFIPYFNCGSCIACRIGKPNCCSNIKVCGVHIDGGMVEYLNVPDYSLINGDGLSFDELAFVEPLAIGAHGIRRAEVIKDEFLLVIGAGPIGMGTMEFARIIGAKVIAMDINESRLDFCKKELKVDFTVNPSISNALEKLQQITNGEMPTVVIDATGNQKAINDAFQYIGHGGRYVLIGLQKDDITFNHAAFHKREGTLMSSRNATRQDFEYVVSCIKKSLINPSHYITHRVQFDQVKNNFESWLNPSAGVIKAMVEI